ncbi:hypothetical protein HYH02_009852 [Chlamydomonas schloesseri]|uniref:TRP C-terminal domain-containing protein n=1 Tax=Chlamydomonas schloesseri TaxID=2026947 RepID=A0A835W9R5_9CHLO|nr:hypothetical protein HYH02_009852 [Chlamydomonas schloesseri]|eukprot:KAG2442061.1 hypothetical protein HYH02_009852 [Chlamydomonas schloesseri]
MEDGVVSRQTTNNPDSPAETPTKRRASFAKSMRRALGNGAAVVKGKLVPKASLSSTITHMDTAVSLPQQLLMVLLVASFILYPALVSASLSFFACRVLDTGVDPYPETQQAAWAHGYWLPDMNQACYSGLHSALYLPVGIVCAIVFCALPPIVVFSILFAKRKKLHERQTQILYGFLYRRYRTKYYFWESVGQLQMLILVAIDVFGRALPEYQQALLLICGLSVIGMLNMACMPVIARVLTVMEFLSLGVLSLTITMGLFFVKTTGETLGISAGAETAVGIIILLINVQMRLLL